MKGNVGENLGNVLEQIAEASGEVEVHPSEFNPVLVKSDEKHYLGDKVLQLHLEVLEPHVLLGLLDGRVHGGLPQRDEVAGAHQIGGLLLQCEERVLDVC